MTPVHNVTFTGTFTAAQFPFGTVVGNTVATLSAAGGPVVSPQNLDSAGVAVFVGVPDGSYVLTVRTFDAQGNGLGLIYSAPVVVSDPAVTINVISGGTITIS